MSLPDVASAVQDRPACAPPYSGVAAALDAARARIAVAARAAGRDPGAIGLVAVSKFHPAAAVEAARQAGQTLFGENRVQEAAAKFGNAAARAAIGGGGVRLHVIGPLQTNKARDAVRVADVIETLDRVRLADAIEDAAAREGRMPRLLVQVNVGDEGQKAGVSRAEADGFIAACRVRFGDHLAGLMCIPPALVDPLPFFGYLASLASVHGLPELSMGMSDDCEAAVEAGATRVRIGTAIFGPRPAPEPAG